MVHYKVHKSCHPYFHIHQDTIERIHSYAQESLLQNKQNIHFSHSHVHTTHMALD